MNAAPDAAACRTREIPRQARPLHRDRRRRPRRPLPGRPAGRRLRAALRAVGGEPGRLGAGRLHPRLRGGGDRLHPRLAADARRRRHLRARPGDDLHPGRRHPRRRGRLPDRALRGPPADRAQDRRQPEVRRHRQGGRPRGVQDRGAAPPLPDLPLQPAQLRAGADQGQLPAIPRRLDLHAARHAPLRLLRQGGGEPGGARRRRQDREGDELLGGARRRPARHDRRHHLRHPPGRQGAAPADRRARRGRQTGAKK